MSWHQGRMCLFDLETTGVDPHRDRIVTAAVILAGGGQPTVTREWLVAPTIPISEGAAAIHGVTNEHAQQHGQDPAAAVVEISEGVLEATQSGIPVVGHNVTYDLTMLLAETMRVDDPGMVHALRQVRPVIDTLVLDKWADKWRKGSRKLVDVARHYGVTLTDEDAHGAAADALAAGRLAWRIAQKYPGCQMDARELHDFLVTEKRDQAESFGRYLAKQGKTDDVARSWPIQEFPTGWMPDQLPQQVEAGVA